jgi:hypothetical protein
MRKTIAEQPVQIISSHTAGSFHDCVCYGIHWDSATFTLGIDLDYIVAWVEPKHSTDGYRFHVAPATLVFRDVDGLQIQLTWSATLTAQIASLSTAGKRANPNGGEEVEVVIEFAEPDGTMSLWTTGYELHVWAGAKEMDLPHL